MSLETAAERTGLPATFIDWEPPEPPTDLIFDDGEPLESNRHRIAMNVLIDSVLVAFEGRTNYFVGGNMFVYYSRQQAMNRDFRGPDFFTVLDVEDTERDRQGWVVWEEDGRYPNVIVELMSPSTAKSDKTTKKDLYERTFKTQAYYIYDPFDPESLQGWSLDASLHYQPIQANQQGWLWCEPLGLWLGNWEGCIRREPGNGTCHWLRFYDEAGQLVLLQDEIAQAAQQEAQIALQEAQAAQQEAQFAQQEAQAAKDKADRLAARLRALGEDPDTV
jgi:Uma2 family endonuclease